jgi:general stress protein YciG
MTKDSKNDEDQGKMTVEEAGRKGGEALVEKYGPEHMSEIGRKGGEHSHRGNNNNNNNNRKKYSNNKINNKNSNRGLASANKETRGLVAKKGGESYRL